MTRTEKLLYHQIHPLKLLTDWSCSFVTTWLLWEGRWGSAAALSFAPSIVVTLLVLRFADLEALRRTPMGRYVATFMNRRVEALRFAGQAVTWVGAVTHVPWLVPFGFLIITYGWLSGLWLPLPATDDPSTG